MEIPEFLDKKQLFEFLVANKSRIIAAKKAVMKCADPVIMPEGSSLTAIKSESEGSADELQAKVVINTTNLMDSHDDVHIPGLWNKSLRENRNMMHLQEHEMKFASIISDGVDLKAYVQDMTWKELGQKFTGSTQALVFDSTVKMSRNAYMFGQYKSGNVRNHSVGMVYVKLEMAINDPDFKDEYSTWKKYIDQVANRDQAEAKGYFFPVLEAKIIEGSAVPVGSNWVTPTISITSSKEPPDEGTPKQPPQGTEIDLMKAIREVKILI